MVYSGGIFWRLLSCIVLPISSIFNFLRQLCIPSGLYYMSKHFTNRAFLYRINPQFSFSMLYIAFRKKSMWMNHFDTTSSSETYANYNYTAHIGRDVLEYLWLICCFVDLAMHVESNLPDAVFNSPTKHIHLPLFFLSHYLVLTAHIITSLITGISEVYIYHRFSFHLTYSLFVSPSAASYRVDVLFVCKGVLGRRRCILDIHFLRLLCVSFFTLNSHE